MAICAESSNHIVVNAFLLAFYLRCIEQNGGRGNVGETWQERMSDGDKFPAKDPLCAIFWPQVGFSCPRPFLKYLVIRIFLKLIKSVPWPGFHLIKSRYLPGQILIAAALFGLVPKVFFKLL